jgi:ATP-dependent Clp endopeptidase proteolytic subunit ClpP
MGMPFLWKPAQQPGTYIDVGSYLLEQRTLFIGPELSAQIASQISMQLLVLCQEREPVSLYINCYGGSVPAGLSIVDLVRYATQRGVPIHTYCLGECIGIAAAILVSGTRGERRAFPSARISLYQEWYGVESLWGAVTQDKHERDRLMGVIREVFAGATDPEKLPPDRLGGFLQSLEFVGAADAVSLGLVDKLCGS